MNTSARAIAAAALVLGSSAVLADSLDMTVQATVTGTCRIQSTPAIDFGTLNQVTAPVVNRSGDIVYKCTKGTPAASITIGGVLNTSSFTGSLSNTIDNIAYTLSWSTPTTTAGSGLGSTASAITVAVAASMPGGANYQDKSAGTYSQTVLVTVSN